MRDLQSIKRELANSGRNFLLLSAIPALRVHIQFVGSLEDKEVLWDATVQTLASYLSEPSKPQHNRKDAENLRSFMRIEKPQNKVSKIHIVLAVPMIDEPTIKKTIIMIRCYKRLKVGYHDFGRNL